MGKTVSNKVNATGAVKLPRYSLTVCDEKREPRLTGCYCPEDGMVRVPAGSVVLVVTEAGQAYSVYRDTKGGHKAVCSTWTPKSQYVEVGFRPDGIKVLANVGLILTEPDKGKDKPAPVAVKDMSDADMIKDLLAQNNKLLAALAAKGR